MVNFSVRSWGAWAPGLDQPDNWLEWAAGRTVIAAEGEPKAAGMPPALRRRAARQVRMAFEAAYACVRGEKNIPVVFCSRHGEVQRAIDILESLTRGEQASPASFSLSVHNVISGLYSIALADTAPMTAIAGGRDSAAQGLIEACCQLAAGADEVLLVVYEEPLPALYQCYRDEPEAPYAWAWLITAPHGQTYSLSWNEPIEEVQAEASGQPFGLALMRCFLSDVEQRRLPGQGKTWHWSRHA